MTDTDRPDTAPRRLFRLLADVARPFVWLFALIGVALILCPDTVMRSVRGERTAEGVVPLRRPPGRVRVTAAQGKRVLPITGAGGGENWSPHPRMLVVKALGGPRPEFAGDHRAVVLENVVPISWSLAGLLVKSGITYRESYLGQFDSETRTPHTLHTAGVSLWPLVLAAAALGVLLWRRRIGQPAGEAPRRGLTRRLLRPWALLAAGVGLFVVLLQEAEVGLAKCTGTVNRGPADTLHPRALELMITREDRLTSLTRFTTPWVFAAPTSGAWLLHIDAVSVRNEKRNVKRPVFTAVGVSLWWFAAAGLLANAVTLWRERRRAIKPPA